MKKKVLFRICMWLLAAVLLTGILPGGVRAQSNVSFRRVLTAEDVTDGIYVLMVSGQAMTAIGEDDRIGSVSAVMEEGRPVPEPGILWQLTLTGTGAVLTDPEGKTLSAGDGGWDIACENMLFRFSSGEGENAVTLGYSGGFFVTAQGDPEGMLPDFALFRQTETEPPVQTKEAPAVEGLYFGLLHAHSALSGGSGTAEEVLARAAENMDFLALTDSGSCLTEETWNARKSAAEAAGSGSFAALRGYEMNWTEENHLGHIALIGGATFHSPAQASYQSAQNGLENYYRDLAQTQDSVGHFLHPGNYWGNFRNFAFDEEADRVIQLLEVYWDGQWHPDAYTAALDKGWHVAPTFGADPYDLSSGETGRTVVQAEAVDGLMEGLRSRRVYATEDEDLHILWTLDETSMGQILTRRQVGDTAELDITLYDPTDTGAGRVEVMGPGGAVLAAAQPDSNPGRITLSLPGDKDYYYLRITQSDGDIALTAPVWVRQQENVEIAEFTCATAIPIQGESVKLVLKLKNGENVPLEVNSVELLVDEAPCEKWDTPFRVEGDSTLTKELTYTHNKLGQSEVKVRIHAELEGHLRTYEAGVNLSARRRDMLRNILVDGAHGNTSPERLQEFGRLAGEQNLQVMVCTEEITEEMLGSCALLVIPEITREPSAEFVAAVREYVQWGGRLLVCADSPLQAGMGNALLAALGSSLSFGEELPEHRPQKFNSDQNLCAGINENQVYYLKQGCAVLGAGENWLAKDKDDKVILARETMDKGEILVCGSLLPADEAIKAPQNLWEEAFANRTIVLALLGVSRKPIAISNIRQVRAGTDGDICRIQGYVTSDKFPGELFVQDQTGGIGITPVGNTGIRQGEPVEILGVRSEKNGEPVIQPISIVRMKHSSHWYQPQKVKMQETRNLQTYGGQLLQVTGICTERTLDRDGVLQSFVIKDSAGRKLTVRVEDTIVSSVSKVNDLHKIVDKDVEIWAIGILQRDEWGQPWLRIRNCAEVVTVEPIPDTSDTIAGVWAALVLSAMGLALLPKRRTIQ